VFAYKPEINHEQTMLSTRKDRFLFLLAKLLGTNIVFTAHNVWPHEEEEKRAFFMRVALKIIYSCSKVIIVHSNFSREKLAQAFRIKSKKIRVIPHGNYLFFRNREMSGLEARRILGLDAGKKIIIQFGALREYKGIDILLDAFVKVRAKNESAFLLLAGKPINLDKELIEQKIRAYNLQNDVLLKAEYIPFEHIAVYFFASDVAVFPYKEIDMSGSLQIAYAFAKPVVCASFGGIPEVVNPGKNGILLQFNDSAALAESLLGLLDNQELIRKMGEESLRMAREDFSWVKIASATIKVYQELRRG
jgi:glycosyltransferase involved in cell wall biosynthesis